LKKYQNSLKATLALIRAGLWEKDVRLLPFDKIDYDFVLVFSQQHAVTGLVAAGIEHVLDIRIPQAVALTYAGSSLQIERRNKKMNEFIASMTEKMRRDDIYTILVKGQGLAQCYERPLWRTSGDIDFFFARDSYNKVIEYFKKLSSNNTQDSRYTKSYTVIIDQWSVELHGTLRSGLSTRLDHEIDSVQDEVFKRGDVRTWRNGNTIVHLPGIDSDLFLLFTHFVRHFYHNEFIIRQACDWCRFLCTFKEEINVDLLEKRLRNSHLMNEWKSFAAYAVDYLGMPVNSMPLYEDSEKWHTNASKILSFIMSDSPSNRVRDTLIISKIFPSNTVRFLPSLLFNVNGMKLWERIGNR